MAHDLTNYISVVCTRVAEILEVILREDERKEPLWSETEEILTDAHLLFIKPFLKAALPEPKAQRLKSEWNSIVRSAPEFKDVNGIKLGAINWRGLYLENGRRTRMAPGSTLKRKGQDYEWLERLHHEYLEAAGKHVSINQIFLEWDIHQETLDKGDDLRQQLLTITYDEKTKSSIGVDTRRRVQVSLSAGLCEQLLPLDTKDIFRNHKAQLRPNGNFHLLKQIRENVDRQVEKTIRFVLKGEPNFFEQFRLVFTHDTYTKEAITRFQEWITSLLWLRIFCNPHFAGTSFYTVRIPNVLPDIEGYPDSSITLVSQGESRKIEKHLRLLAEELENNERYRFMKGYVREIYNKWAGRREAGPKSESPDYGLWNLIPGKEQRSNNQNINLPIDFKKLAFICRLASYLAGTRHEGHSLRFAFLLGFTHDQTIGQLEGAVEQYGTDLELPETINPNDYTHVATWIEANALILQRWDLTLFFETYEENQEYAVGKRLLRIKRLEHGDSTSSTPKWSGHPTNEFELRRSLVQITSEQKGTSALLVSERGATLILRGRSYLFRHEGDSGSERFIPLMSGNESFVEEFETKLTGELQKLARDLNDAWRKRSQQLRTLAEALVTMGHGALIAIRISDKTNIPTLPPLAPVWKLRETQTVADLSEDIMTFALASALDGATEIIFQPNGDNGEVVFRRYANEKVEPWVQVNGKISQNSELNDIAINWREMMTFGTRHRSAFALSLREEPDKVLVLTVSADGPVRLWSGGKTVADIKFKP